MDGNSIVFEFYPTNFEDSRTVAEGFFQGYTNGLRKGFELFLFLLLGVLFSIQLLFEN